MLAEPNQCDICASALRPLYPRVRDPQTGETFSINQCVSCGLGHTSPHLVDLARYYGPQYHGGRYGFTEQLAVSRRVRFVRAVARPQTILDFGCGDGAFLAAAAELGWRVTGVEVHPWHARERGLIVTERIEEAVGPFDVVTLWHSLEHVRSPRELMQAITARLNADGTVLVAVPNLDGIQARTFKQHWFHLDVPRHLFHFTPTALTRLLKSSGLRVVRRWNLESEQDLFGWTQGFLNRIVPHSNVLFDVLTARGDSHKRWEAVASLVLGGGITVVSAPIVPLAAVLSKGAVMIFAAKLSQSA